MIWCGPEVDRKFNRNEGIKLIFKELQPAVVAYAPQVASSETGTISGTQDSGLTENSGSYGGSSYNEIPVSFDEQDDLENDQENKKGWKAEMIKLIEDIRQNITELQEGIIFRKA